MNIVLKHSLLFVIFTSLQVFLLNDISFWHAVPLLYIYVLILWPSNWSRITQTLLGFVLGILIDIASDTLGMHAFATTFVAFFRQPLLDRFILSDNTSIEPGEHSMGFQQFWKYTLCIVGIHQSLLFVIESFSWFSPFTVFLRILFSTVLTLALVFVMERFRK